MSLKTTIPELFSVLFLLAAGARASAPNVVIIFNDDQGYQDLGCYGSPDIKTPRVDQLAREGMKFTDFYVASPVCSASRAALLTGCYPFRVGVGGVFFPNTGAEGLDPKHVTIAEMLKSVGYKTMAVGKWHLGDHVQFLPTNQGFDSYYGIPYSNDMFPSKIMTYADDCLYREAVTPEKVAASFPQQTEGLSTWQRQPHKLKDKVPLMRNEECVEFPVDQTTITQRFATEGIRFITESVKEQKPFFLYLANSMPHTPLFASPQFKGKSARGLYGDVIEEIDYNTGRVLDHLDALGIADNTIVIFSSDNGPWLIRGEHGGSALPLFEGKMTHFEGGQRVPAIIRWPGKIPAGSVCEEIALSMDILPTLAAITGAELKPTTPIDGKNILKMITAEEGAATPHKYFFFGRSAVRSGDWKYHQKETFKVKATQREPKGPTLYNLSNDIGESENVIDQYPEIAERLKKALDAHKAYLQNKKQSLSKNDPQQKLDWSKVKVGDVFASKSAPDVVKKAIQISGVIEVAADAEQVVIAHGGTLVGYTLYLSGGELVFAVSTGRDHVERLKTPVPSGQITFEAGMDAKGYLFVQAGAVTAVKSQKGGHWVSRWPAENLSVGFDVDHSVDSQAPKGKFKGQLVALVVE